MRFFVQPLTYVLGLILLMAVTFIALRVPPVAAFHAFMDGAIGNRRIGFWDPISESLMETAPLLMTALSVVIAWRAGMFSIGAEGQLLIGALAAVTVWNFASRLPAALLIPLMLGSAALAGAVWSGIAGWLRIRKGVQEVISTIMLNYVALNLVGWAALGPLHGKSQSGPYAEPLPDRAMFPHLIPIEWSGYQTRLHAGVLIAFICVPLVWLLLYRTVSGFGIRLIGQNAEAARVAGYEVDRLRMIAMTVSGALCGLAGAIELLHDTGRLGSDFSPGWGYNAIPVALLGGLSPLGTLVSAVFFGGLAAGAANAQRTPGIGVPSVVSYIVQAASVLAIVGMRSWQNRRSGDAAE